MRMLFMWSPGVAGVAESSALPLCSELFVGWGTRSLPGSVALVRALAAALGDLFILELGVADRKQQIDFLPCPPLWIFLHRMM